jgi:DNA replication protein DnaC
MIMLLQPTLDKLRALRLSGMAEHLREQQGQPRYHELSFEERLGLMVDHEWDQRRERKLARYVKEARFREPAVMEDLDLSAARGLDKTLILKLAQGNWIRNRLNVIVTGPTGVGKTYLACALGRALCGHGIRVRYLRTGRLLQELTLGQANGTWSKSLDAFARVQLLIFDDWLRDPLKVSQTRELLELLDDRWQARSTLLVSQLPVAEWHQHMGDATLADAVLDRLVHHAHKIEMKGESRRKLKGKQMMQENR